MLNSVHVMGRLTKDAELRVTPNKTPVCNFTIAVNRGGESNNADFLDVVAWKGTAEFINRHFHKGDAIIVSGSLQSRQYEDKNGGKRKVVEIVAHEVNFCGSKKNNNIQEADDDLPWER